MYFPLAILTCVVLVSTISINEKNPTALKRALQKDHEKPRPEKWADMFLGKSNNINYQLSSLVNLLHIIARHLDDCTVMILYDSSAESIDKIILEKLFKDFPLAYLHGRIDTNLTIPKKLSRATGDKCVSYMMFLKDVMKAQEIIGKQMESKVVIIARSSQWRVHEFLASNIAQDIVNLLIISKSEQIRSKEENAYILYTHKLYTDGLGSSAPHILMSWYKNRLTKPKTPIFPKKITDGFAGHRFVVAVADQPPYVINRGKDNHGDDDKWDGVEIRLLSFLADMLNFTTDFHGVPDANLLGSGDAVVKIMNAGKADIGLAGIYVTQDRTDVLEMSHGHSQDCAAFISMTSTALPRYRAIMGPFHWTVWLALTLTYLLAIFPIAFSDRMTLMHLIKNPEEIENMFWYVFGTFTNCFTFSGEKSWSKTEKTSTRMFIGWYWVFTIIVSACYTGSIIAFVTLPVFPTTIDTTQQLINGRFQIGTLDRGGWQYWFENSTDKKTSRLFKGIEFLPTIEAGLKNISRAFFWPYAFLGSRDQLDYIIRTNFTTRSKRSVLHISSECFTPFSVSVAFPKYSVYKSILNTAILRSFQSGLVKKMKNDVEWDIMRSSTGKMLQANSVGKIRAPTTDDRALTLQDTQGMFLLLGAGFLMGAASLLSEWLGGCVKFCKTGKRSRYGSISTNYKSFHVPTPNEQTQNQVYSHDGSAKTTRSNKLDHAIHDNHEPDLDIDPVIVHKVEIESCDNVNGNDNDLVTAEKHSVSWTDESDDLDYEINNLFNFDHLFGEDNSIMSEDCDNNHSDKFGEVIQDCNGTGS